ncbi:MAG: ABC transporter ATP-binding protein [Candidatus Eisenbacteria bacterium]|uniref:ABC transporter ATP-binding protein n=1 Tax=Eiseniibacteriota bacterium TaxID=2212470 RepID=A0A538SLW7_UNCEI|nr:MAG: ABC transporter ATP-binding protein [Candidatus Eisenbacteria bacterium]
MSAPWEAYGHDEEKVGAVYDHGLAKRLIRYLKPYRKEILISVVLLAAISLLEVAGPYITKVAIDTYVRPLHGVGPVPAVAIRGLIVLSLAYMGILIVAFALRYWQTYTMSMVGQRAMQDLRLEIFKHVETLTPTYFDTRPVGRILTRVTQDVSALSELFAQGVVAVIGDIFLLAGIIGAMLWMNWKLALVVFTTIPLLVLATGIFRAKVRVSYRRVRTRLACINAYTQEHLQGMEVVKLFNVEAKEFRGFDRANKDHLTAHLQNLFYYAVFFPTVEFIGAIALALIVWYGGLGILGSTVTFGVVVAFLQYSERFYQPVRDLSEKYNVFQSAMVASERIFDLLDTKPAVPEPERPTPVGRLRGGVEFDRVWFAYKDDDFVLRDISFRIAPGEKVALVGATGAGKSSIANLLTRFYEFQRGSIRVDGHDIREIEGRALRRQIGLVLQDVFLFAGSVRENLRFGARERDAAEAERALQEIGGGRMLGRLPRGLEEEVGERGVYFSMGERQLLAFARALHYDPSLLILDEATSSVDVETERVIQSALRRLLEGRTSLVIAHRLSTILDADRILVMHKGELREQGTHAELLARGGIYARLYELQYSKQEDRFAETVPGTGRTGGEPATRDEAPIAGGRTADGAGEGSPA